MTNLPEMDTSRKMVGVYLRRKWVELRMNEWKEVVGPDQYQVPRKMEQLEYSVVSIIAYLFLLKLHAKDIPAG